MEALQQAGIVFISIRYQSETIKILQLHLAKRSARENSEAEDKMDAVEVLTCAQCSTECPGSYRFCYNCGKSLDV